MPRFSSDNQPKERPRDHHGRYHGKSTGITTGNSPAVPVDGDNKSLITLNKVSNKPLSKEEIQTRFSWLLDTAYQYLNTNGLIEKLDKATLRDIVNVMSISAERILENQVAAQQLSIRDHKALDQLAPALLAEIQRRGLTVKAVERTVSIEAPVPADLVIEAKVIAGTNEPIRD
jgi:hypothetical protein